MKLGEIIREYRMRNRISMADFAKASRLSKPYVSMLEADKNSKSGKPIKPSVETVVKVSVALGVTAEELLKKLGDEDTNSPQYELSEEETALVDGYRELNDESKRLIFGMIRQLNLGRVSTTRQAAAI